MMTKITAEQVLADYESLSDRQKRIFLARVTKVPQKTAGLPEISTKQASTKKRSAGSYQLLMDGELIEFEKGYLETHEDLWMLNALVGSQAVMESLKQTKQIDDTFVENLMAKCRIEFHTNERHTYLFSTRSELLEFDFGPLLPVKPLNALKAYGLQKLEDASEKMYTKI
jgi:hypothetical protein